MSCTTRNNVYRPCHVHPATLCTYLVMYNPQQCVQTVSCTAHNTVQTVSCIANNTVYRLCHVQPATLYTDRAMYNPQQCVQTVSCTAHNTLETVSCIANNIVYRLCHVQPTTLYRPCHVQPTTLCTDRVMYNPQHCTDRVMYSQQRCIVTIGMLRVNVDIRAFYCVKAKAWHSQTITSEENGSRGDFELHRLHSILANGCTTWPSGPNQQIKTCNVRFLTKVLFPKSRAAI